MIETREPLHPIPLTPGRWAYMRSDLNRLFREYGELDAERALTTDETEFGEAWLAKSTFLHYFNTGALATDAQLISWLRGTLTPFDPELNTLCGITATDAISICKAIGDHLEGRDDAAFLTRLRARVAIPKTEAAETAVAYAFFRDDLAGVAKPAAVDAFWYKFMILRGRLPASTTFPTDPHHLERHPFVELIPELAFLTVPGAALEAIGSQLSSALLESSSRERYLKRRDDFLESEVVRIFREFFIGSDARLFAGVRVGEFEHDLVVVSERTVIVVEAKAGAMHEPFRDIDKARKRLKQNFDRIIGEAHRQTSRTRARLLAGEQLTLCDERGNPLHILDGRNVKEVFTICVTAEDFGPLGRDMSLLLTKSRGEIYPWAVMLNDLLTFLVALRHLGKPPSALYTYLRQRATVHGHVECGDELELAGYFLTHGTLLPLSQTLSRVLVDPSYSDIFDELLLVDALTPDNPSL